MFTEPALVSIDVTSTSGKRL